MNCQCSVGPQGSVLGPSLFIIIIISDLSVNVPAGIIQLLCLKANRE